MMTRMTVRGDDDAEMMTMNERAIWTRLSDPELMAQCEVDTYRASGPGGQKRNKTSSAVRIRHLPSSLIVIAEESRSQHENRARAFRRLRAAFYLKVREPIAAEELNRETLSKRSGFPQVEEGGRLRVGRKQPEFWPTAGLVLDVLAAVQARVSEAAELLGISTANLIDFLQIEPKVWEQANQLRAQFQQKPLRS